MVYYRIDKDDWSDSNKFKTLCDAKKHVWLNYTDREKVKAFNKHEGAAISKVNAEGDVLTQTSFFCDEKGTHYGRTVKCY